VTDVKDQGACGSCYAFSGNTTLESDIAIRWSKAPLRLSEQEIVECSGGYGNQACNGGLEIWNWAYQRDEKAVSDADYGTYEAGRGVINDCSASGKTKSA